MSYVGLTAGAPDQGEFAETAEWVFPIRGRGAGKIGRGGLHEPSMVRFEGARETAWRGREAPE